jgi:hypothetical protein
VEQGKKLAIGGIVVGLLAVGVRVGLIYKERHEDVKPKVADSGHIDPDYNVFLKKMRPDKLQDEKDLKGKTLWVSAGGQMDYYPYNAGKVDYAHSQGVLLGAEPIVVDDAIEAKAPTGTNATFRIPGGDKQVLLVFTKAGAPTEWATPVGFVDKGTYTFSTDEIFFYDDPHKLYSHWSPEIWKAVDEHRAIPGMTEREVQMALGQVSHSESQDEGNRTVRFDHQGKPIDVTFVKNRATTITPQ